MNYQTFSLTFGFSVFVIATLAVRFWGTYLFDLENSLLIITLFLSVIPSLYFLIKFAFNWSKVNNKNRLKSAVFMALPGMLCDVFCIGYHPIVFPELSKQQVIIMGSWVLWTYSFVIILGLIVKDKNI